jgi:hypothetical protein
MENQQTQNPVEHVNMPWPWPVSIESGTPEVYQQRKELHKRKFIGSGEDVVLTNDDVQYG